MTQSISRLHVVLLCSGSLLAWAHALSVGDAMPCVCESPICGATRLIPVLAQRDK